MTNTPEARERVARAIYTARNGRWDYNAWRSDPRTAEAYRKDADAAMEAMQGEAL